MNPVFETRDTSLNSAAAPGVDYAGVLRAIAGRIDLRTLERLFILQTMAAVNGSRKLAVARLGISERTLRNKLKQYTGPRPV